MDHLYLYHYLYYYNLNYSFEYQYLCNFNVRDESIKEIVESGELNRLRRLTIYRNDKVNDSVREEIL